MTEARNQFGRAASIQASSVGRPGQRRFRVIVQAKNGATATAWMEKQQLFNLAVTVKNLISEVETAKDQGRTLALRDGVEEPLPHVVQHLEFQVGRMAVGYDERSGLYLFAASSEETEEGALPDISVLATENEMEAMADEAFEVCAAGRPLCPLCGAPLNSEEKHVCSRQNGHHGNLGETRDFA